MSIKHLFTCTYELARPYGRTKLLVVFLWVLTQGVSQVVGVTSIFPFLALAADPDRARNTDMGRTLLAFLPALDNTSLLFVAGLLAIAMLFLNNALNLMSEMARVRYAHEFGHWLRMRLLRQFAFQPYAFFLQHNSNTLLRNVAHDVMQFVQGVLLPLLDSGARILTVLLLVLLTFFVNPTLALCAAAGLGGFYAIVFLYLHKRLAATSDGLKGAQHFSWHEASQLLNAIKPAKVQRAERFFISRFAHHSLQQARLMAWIPLYSNGPRYLIEPLAFGGLVAIVLMYAAQKRNVAEILPQLGVMALAGYRLIPTLQLLYGQLAQLRTMTHYLEALHAELRTPNHSTTDERDALSPTPLEWHQAITLDNLTFRYPGAATAVIDDLSLTIPKHACVAFVGTTGCGKSTLLDLVLGLHVPTSGRILIDGNPLSAAQMPAWLAGIGYVPQDIVLIDDTVAANIALGVPAEDIDYNRLHEVCAIAQLQPLLVDQLPDGFQTLVGERGVRLSGGQRQRIGLARALYHRPHLLILDEATSSLDQATESDLMAALEPLRGSLTMLIVAHRLSTIERCDNTYTLSAGTVTAASAGHVAAV